jgi:HK97 family phage portal protein
MPIIDAVLSRMGLQRKGDAPPIIHNGGKNLPSINVSYGGLGSASWTSRGYWTEAREGYLRNADVYSCISLIAQAGQQVKWWDDAIEGEGGEASLPLRSLEQLVEATGNGAKLRAIRQSKLLDSEARARQIKTLANPSASIELLKKAGGATFIHDWLSYLLLSGNAYIEVEGIGAGPISMLWLDRPDRVGLIPGDIPFRGRPASWRVATARGMWYEVPNATAQPGATPKAPCLVQSKLFNPLDDVFGMAPLDAAMLAVDTTNEGQALQKRLLERGFAPGWIEATKDSLWDDKQVGQLKKRLADSKLRGEEFFLENATWHQIGFNPGDSGVTENKVAAKRDIASCFHVPSQLIGDSESQTYNNWREARRALYMEAVIPLLVQFRDDWNRTIGAILQSPLEFDKDTFDAIAAAREEATDRVHKLWTSGLIMQNEGRDDLEYDRVDGGDAFYAPANFLPLGESAAPAPAPAPKKP